MAKISELPSASTLDGTEIVPVVQGGVTKQSLIRYLITLPWLRKPVLTFLAT